MVTAPYIFGHLPPSTQEAVAFECVFASRNQQSVLSSQSHHAQAVNQETLSRFPRREVQQTGSRSPRR